MAGARCAAWSKKYGKQCWFRALRGTSYCQKHQGQGPEILQRPDAVEKCAANKLAYYNRMRAHIAEGLIGKMPQTENLEYGAMLARLRREQILAHPLDTPGLKMKRPKKVKAQEGIPLDKPEIVQQKLDKIVEITKRMPDVLNVPFDHQPEHDKLVTLTGMSLVRIYEVLQLPFRDKKTGEIDYKALSAVKDTALRAITTRIRVDRNAMMQKKVDTLARILGELKKPGDEAKLIEGEVVDSEAAE